MTSPSDRYVRRWLVASALAVVLAIVIGGITRLTDSGLSITEWRPVSGIFPPRTATAWEEAYQRFQQIPQAQSTHRGISMTGFQRIYWWEWIHRMLARLVGLVLAVPYVLLLLRGHIRRKHRRRLLWLPLLAATQGGLGWWMVSSGLADRTSVSPIRLTVHLGVALVILILCVWTALALSPPQDEPPPGGELRTLRRVVGAAAALVFLTLLSGGLVAGLDAGLVYNTFPAMGPGVIPVEYGYVTSWWPAALGNPVIVQFHHRLLGVTAGLTLLVLAAWSQLLPAPPAVRRAALATGLAALLQIGLGIATLVLRVPVTLAVLHQLTGVTVLIGAVWTLQRITRIEAKGR
jgi:cytochrome c oxidase assembly protein subunit 15